LEDPHVDRHQAVIEASADTIAIALADIEYWLYAAGAIIVGSLFLGLFTRGPIAQAFIFSAGNGVKTSLPASLANQAS
jgi:hypothetical protein